MLRQIQTAFRWGQRPLTLGVSGHADSLGKPPGFFHIPKISEK